jgi:hypothetical protein
MPGHDPPRRLRLVANVLVLALIGGYFAADLRLDRVRAVEYHDRKPTPGRGQDWLLAGFRPGPHGGGPVLARLTLVHLSQGGADLVIGLPPGAHAPGRIQGTLASAYARRGAAGLVAEVEAATGISVERYAGIRLADADGLGETGDPGDASGTAASARGTAGTGEAGPVSPAGFAPDAPMDAVGLLARTAAGAVTLDEADHLHHLARLAAALGGLGGPPVRVRVPIVRSADLPGTGRAVIWDAAQMRELADAVSADRPPPAGLVVTGAGR